MKNNIKFLIVNGPNLNLLGDRENEIYGNSTLDDIKQISADVAAQHGVDIEFFQSNSEGELIDFLHKNRSADGIVINPGAFTHTSIAIRDAISGLSIPTVEVHLSNIHSREDFRTISYIAPVSIGQISGFGVDSYILGITALANYVRNK